MNFIVSKSNRLANIIRVYLQGDLELDTAVAELVYAYVGRGWRFSLIESDCDPRYRGPMHTLAVRVDAEIMARRESAGRGLELAPPIVIQ
jgi:hypothetical protein